MDSGMMMHKLEELHLTQLNLILLNNFYKQIYEGKAESYLVLTHHNSWKKFQSLKKKIF